MPRRIKGGCWSGAENVCISTTSAHLLISYLILDRCANRSRAGWTPTDGGSRHETWSLVEADGERKILFEAHEVGKAGVSQTVEQRFLALREALRGPQDVTREIWLGLED